MTDLVVTGNDVSFCHKTQSGTNPYVPLTTSPQGVLNGHLDHQWGMDIIPPFDYTAGGVPKHFPGQNWSQALWDNGCIALSVKKTGDAQVQPGGTIHYSIAVTNLGGVDIPLSAVNVVDPTAVLTPPSTPPAFIPAGGTRTWTAVSKDPAPAGGASCGQQVPNTVTVSFADRAASLAAIDAEGLVVLLKQPASVSDTWTTTVVCPPTVGISKTATKASVAPGGLATYDVTVTNNGLVPVPFASINVSDPTADLTPPSDTSDLGVGQSRVWTATTQVPSDAQCGGTVDNTASVTLGAPQVPTLAADVVTPPSASASTPVVCPVQVAVSKTAGQPTVQPGGTVTYTISVTNPGDFAVPGSAISVVDPGATLGDPDTTGDLAPGATRTWPATKSVDLDPATCGTQVTNTASVFLSGLPAGWVDSGAGARSSTAAPVGVDGGICANQVQILPQQGAPVAFRPVTGALGITKTGPKSSLAGGKVTFQITVTNNGAGDLTGVVIRDQPPAAMLLVGVPAGATRTGGRVTWDIGTLASGQSVTKSVTVKVLRTIRGRTCNTATAVADGTDRVASRACTTVQAGRRPATPVTG